MAEGGARLCRTPRFLARAPQVRLQAGDQDREEAALDEIKKRFGEHRAAITEATRLATQQVRVNADVVANNIQQRKTMLIGLTLFIMVIGAGIAIAIARNIARRTAAMAQVLERIASGDLANARRLAGAASLQTLRRS